jgi:hypothetical protein
VDARISIAYSAGMISALEGFLDFSFFLEAAAIR